MKKFLAEFKEFAVRGNVLDMAVGVVIGGAFTAIITAIVENLLTPILGLLLPNNASFVEWAPGGFGIGAVINAIIVFILTALAVFIIVKAINKAASLKKKEEEVVEEEEPAPTTEELLTAILEELKAQK